MSYKLEWKDGNTWRTISSGTEKQSSGSPWGRGYTRVALIVTATETASNIKITALAKVQTKDAYYNNPSNFWLHLTLNDNTTSSSFPSWGYQTYPDNTGAWKDMWYGPDQYTTTGWMQISQEQTFAYGFDNGQNFEIKVTGYNNETVIMRITIDDIPSPTVTFTNANLVNGVLVTNKSSRILTVTQYPTYNINYNFKINNTSVQNGTSNKYTHTPTSTQDSTTYNYTIVVTAPNGTTKTLNGDATFVTYIPPSIIQTIANRSQNAQGLNAFLSITFIPPKKAGVYQNTQCVYDIPKLGISNVNLGSGDTNPVTLSVTTTGDLFTGSNSYRINFRLKCTGLTDLPQSSIILPIAGSGIIDTVFNPSTHKYGISFGAVASEGLMDTGLELGPNMLKQIGNWLMPVGFIYSTNDISADTEHPNGKDPATLFGGTWERIYDTFLYAGAQTGTYAPGQSGGSKNGTGLHTHPDATFGVRKYGTGDNELTIHAGTNTSLTIKGSSESWNMVTGGVSGQHHPDIVTIKTAQGGTDGGNMPPWMAIYVYKRTALAD